MKNFLLISAVATFSLAGTNAFAQQQIKTNALEKVHSYQAPREIQILDERPVVKDFREAPQAAGTIDLPPGPQGSGGGYGGPGAGAAGDPGSSLPSGGLQLGGPNQGYRSAPQELVPLPKSGFGGPSNIPARGLGPKGPLPGVTQGVLGKLLNAQKPTGAGAGSPNGIGNRARSAGNTARPAPAAYSGGYGQGSGSGFGGNSSRTETMVRGSLLKQHN
jgi:hypothetical protein